MRTKKLKYRVNIYIWSYVTLHFNIVFHSSLTFRSYKSYILLFTRISICIISNFHYFFHIYELFYHVTKGFISYYFLISPVSRVFIVGQVFDIKYSQPYSYYASEYDYPVILYRLYSL